MKNAYLYTLLAVVFLMSCDNKEYKHKVIRSKSHLTFTGKPMPDGICRYFYKPSKWADNIEFTDKCEKYNVGDTIVGTVRNYR
uniref:hypothetical protein n=1 Tax=uncultured Tenacibaculum sp. TaxID=174713 RepID=UPI00261B5280|nr:hypothetical protein [uncultured Tenacibaculum sp.]